MQCIRPVAVRPRKLLAAFPIEDDEAAVRRLRHEINGPREPFGLREDSPFGSIGRQTSATAISRLLLPSTYLLMRDGKTAER